MFKSSKRLCILRRNIRANSKMIFTLVAEQ